MSNSINTKLPFESFLDMLLEGMDEPFFHSCISQQKKSPDPTIIRCDINGIPINFVANGRLFIWDANCNTFNTFKVSKNAVLITRQEPYEISDEEYLKEVNVIQVVKNIEELEKVFKLMKEYNKSINAIFCEIP